MIKSILFVFQKYRLCTKEYIAGGKDGYDVFKDCPVVVSVCLSHYDNTHMQYTANSNDCKYDNFQLNFYIYTPPANCVCGRVYCFHVVRPNERTKVCP